MGQEASAQSSDMQSQPQLSDRMDHGEQAGNTTQPTLRSSQEKGQHPETSNQASSPASFLTHTDLVLRFRKEL